MCSQLLGELSLEDAGGFGSGMEIVLSSELSLPGWCWLMLPLPAHSSAKKLVSLPGSRGPVWPVLNCLLKEGAKRKEEMQKTVVVALRSLAGVLCVDVCQLLQPAVENMVEDVCRVGHTYLTSSPSSSSSCVLMQPSFTEQSQQTKQLFCSFIGKLFLDAGYSANRE